MSVLAQGRFWRVELARGGEVQLKTLRDGLRSVWPDDHEEIKDQVLEVPLGEWSRLLKCLHAERKLLGGLLLDFARSKDGLAAIITRDRLVHELQRVVTDATIALVEQGRLVVRVPEGN